MKWHVGLILVLPLLVAADQSTQKPDKADIAALQGIWVLKTTEYLGEEADQDVVDSPIEKALLLGRRLPEEKEVPEDFTRYRTILEIKGNSYDYRQWIVPFCGGKGREGSVNNGTYKLDVSRTPKVMERRFGGSIHYFIYRVNGETLQLALHFDNDLKKLPKTFRTDKDEDVVVLTFQREKK